MLYFFVFLGSLAWLIPNHYPPWTAAWGEGVAIASILLMLFWHWLRDSYGRISVSLLAVALISGFVVVVQVLLGVMLFVGDAWVVVLYLGLWASAVIVGRSFVDEQSFDRQFGMLISFWLAAALVSVGIALVQQTNAFGLGIFAADLPPGGRPFANLAQPNNFCTLCFIGVCCLFLLRQIGQIGNFAFWLGAAFLGLGMVVTQSRTGWGQIILLAAFVLGIGRGSGLWISRNKLIVLVVAFFSVVLLWPSICDAFYWQAGRPLNDQMQAGVRLPYWGQMLDAIGREPLWGYGWQQVGKAQQLVSIDHPPIGVMFDHGHNIILDLLLWNGIPLGGLIIGILVWWLLVQIWNCKDARKLWLLVALSGVFLHAMLEFPLDYAYFLFPVGLVMGAIEGLSSDNSYGKYIKIPRILMAAFSVFFSIIFGLIVLDYINAEDNYRALRMESARIGVQPEKSEAPKLVLLTQLEAFLSFARVEATRGMTSGQLDGMRKIYERFGYPPVMFRYALAEGLNGHPNSSEDVLRRICKIHSAENCADARESWKQLQNSYPELSKIAMP